jgi:hypothetical protein
MYVDPSTSNVTSPESFVFNVTEYAAFTLPRLLACKPTNGLLLRFRLTEVLDDAGEDDEATATADEPTAITAVDIVAAIAANASSDTLLEI